MMSWRHMVQVAVIAVAAIAIANRIPAVRSLVQGS